jgi:alpha-tubulin suppressor-like RCC1 family protein
VSNSSISIAICVALTLCPAAVHAALVPVSGVFMVKAGTSFSLALRTGGTVWAWGDNSIGQLGDGTTSPSVTPRPVVCGAVAGDPNHCSADGHLKGVQSIAAGNAVAMALLDNGTALIWGNNSKFNNTDNSITPVYVVCGVAAAHCSSGVLTNVSQIAAGFSHVLILLDDGTVLGWGTNNNGNLGNNQPGVPSATPVQVSGLSSGSSVTAITVGQNFSFALKSDSTVLAWGANGGGQLGDGTTTSKSTPVQVVCRQQDAAGSIFCSVLHYLQGVTALAAGNGSSFALLSDGSFLSWGSNALGQLGDGTTTPRRVTPANVCAVGATAPCLVANNNVLYGVSKTFGSSLSNSAYAVESDGTVLAWGSNSNGQIGDGTTTQRTTPEQVSGLGPGSGAVDIAAGDLHCLVLKSDGTALSWGNNGSGQLGNGTIFASTTPVQTFGLGSGSGVIALTSRGQTTLALRSDGSVLAWGRNANGQLGNGTMDNKNTPIQVVCRAGDVPGSTFCSSAGYLRGVTAVAAGNGHSLALLNDGTVLAWGANGNGQLGDGTMMQRNFPVNVCAAGATPPCSVVNGNILHDVSGIAGGGTSSFAPTSTGAVLAWGNNANGFLGDGTQTQKIIPVNVHCRAGDALGTLFCSNTGFLQGVSAITAGVNSPFALMNDGTVLAWGLNLVNQLGDGTIINRNTPINVCSVGASAPCSIANGNVLQGISSVTGTGWGGLALSSDGSLLAWGANNGGSLGDGTVTNRSAPVNVCTVGAAAPCSLANGNSLRNVSTMTGGSGIVSAGYAVMSDGSVAAWGSNSSGQIGDGTFTNRLVPVGVPWLASNVIAISAGGAFVVALKADGSVLAWGANDVGQLGDGTVYTANLTPSAVLFETSFDTVPPNVTCASPDGQWHAVNESLACTATDSDSGLVNPADASFTLMTNVPLGAEDGNASTGSRTVCDNANNCTIAGPIAANKVDRLAPDMVIGAPAGVTYTLGQTVAASYACHDGGSGVASCVGSVAVGSAIDTNSLGSKTFIVTTGDIVGNTATVAVPYTVSLGGLASAGLSSVWLGLKNSDDIGTKFDVLAEMIKNGSVVGSGQVNDVSGASSGFNNAVQLAIGVVLASATNFGAGDTLGIRLSVRVAATGHRSGTARLWFNDASANSRWQMMVNGVTRTLYMTTGFVLSPAVGTGPGATIDVFVDRAVGGNPFKPFGTWTMVF